MVQSQQFKTRTTQAEASFGDEATARRDHEDRWRLVRVLLREFDLAVVATALIRGSLWTLDHFVDYSVKRGFCQ